MLQIKHIINAQRLLLLTRGYTENRLHVPNQPKLFLSTLDSKLQQLEKEHPNSTTPQVFTHSMSAEFANGKFPVTLDFTYKYQVSRKDLALVSLKASLFDATLVHSMEGKRNTDLMSAQSVLKGLKEKVLVTGQKEAARFIQTHLPKKKQHRGR